MSLIASFPTLLVLAIAATIPLVIGVYVWRDARQRSMNAALWALVSAVAPALIGLILYLLVRGNYSDLRCPGCEAPVKEQFVVCPKCGIRLRAACPTCAMPVEPDWKVCPKCTQSLREPQKDVRPPVRTRDNSVWKVLAILLIVPILLIAVLLFSLTAYSSSGSASFSATSVEEYFEVMNREGDASEAVIAENVDQWLDSLKDCTDRAHALRYDYSTEAGTEHFFLVYIPGVGSQTSSGLRQSGSIFGTTLTLELQGTGNSCTLFNITSSANNAPNIKILLDGKQLPCDVTAVEYNPTLFYIVPIN